MHHPGNWGALSPRRWNGTGLKESGECCVGWGGTCSPRGSLRLPSRIVRMEKVDPLSVNGTG